MQYALDEDVTVQKDMSLCAELNACATQDVCNLRFGPRLLYFVVCRAPANKSKGGGEM